MVSKLIEVERNLQGMARRSTLRRSVGVFVVALLFLEDRASSSRGGFERRLIGLIFAGRNRIIMIRRELPLTVIASPAEPVA